MMAKLVGTRSPRNCSAFYQDLRSAAVAFIHECLLGCGANPLLIGVARCIAVAADDFLTYLNSHQPFFLIPVPGNFHTVCAHGSAPRNGNIHRCRVRELPTEHSLEN